jgi:hypothetical protein
MQHLRTTLPAALNRAVREGVIPANPARHIEVPSYRKPHANVWTDGRVEEWERTGERPAVAVWTAEQLATSLHGVTDDALFARWWLTVLRGLRAARRAGCAGPNSTWSTACCSWSATAPPPATR